MAETIADRNAEAPITPYSILKVIRDQHDAWFKTSTTKNSPFPISTFEVGQTLSNVSQNWEHRLFDLLEILYKMDTPDTNFALQDFYNSLV